jgi:hypothetical protein
MKPSELGVKAVEAGYSVLFLSLETLMTRLTRAVHENRLERSLQQLTYPKVLIIDEIGYLPLSQLEASLFFRLVFFGPLLIFTALTAYITASFAIIRTGAIATPLNFRFTEKDFKYCANVAEPKAVILDEQFIENWMLFGLNCRLFLLSCAGRSYLKGWRISRVSSPGPALPW